MVMQFLLVAEPQQQSNTTSVNFFLLLLRCYHRNIHIRLECVDPAANFKIRSRKLSFILSANMLMILRLRPSTFSPSKLVDSLAGVPTKNKISPSTVTNFVTVIHRPNDTLHAVPTFPAKVINNTHRCMARRLVNHDARVWQRVPHARAASSQQQRCHTSCLAHTPCGYRRQNILHCVIDTKTSSHWST